jgi:hypothetical protein
MGSSFYFILLVSSGDREGWGAAFILVVYNSQRVVAVVRGAEMMEELLWKGNIESGCNGQ